jgi:hypothetical protein
MMINNIMSSENNNDELCEIVQPRRRRGPGKKEYKLTHDPKYYANYYSLKRSVKVHCENCARLVCKGKMYRHVQLPICTRHSKDPEEVQKIKDAYVAEKNFALA